MRIQLICGSEERRQKIRDSPLNAIDYLEVLPRTEIIPRPLLLLYCFKPISELLHTDNVLIQGGVRTKDIGIAWTAIAKTVLENIRLNQETEVTKDLTIQEKDTLQKGIISDRDLDRVLIIRPNRDGDFSIYTLRLIRDLDYKELPPKGFDIILSQIDFTFKVACPTSFDCRIERECTPESRLDPIIDYMAKDYASFRRLMLDRMTTIMPEWKERNAADLGVMLVELLAYVGDHLSYYQDAVSTEAYLGTARRRISFRRHARMLDYYMHEGCNARAWVYIKVNENMDRINVPKKTKFLTGGAPGSNIVLKEEDLDQAIRREGAEVFETMHDVTLYRNHNEISFYTWGEPDCCLPKGAIHATLRNDGDRILDVYVFDWKAVPGSSSAALKEFLRQKFALDWIEKEDLEFDKKIEGGGTGEEKIILIDDVHHLSIELGEEKTIATLIIDDKMMHKFTVKQGSDDRLNVYTLSLKVGDYLLLEEVRSPSTFSKADADPSHRQVVRLTKVEPNVDELDGTHLVEVAWDRRDALDFPLCLWNTRESDENGVEEEEDEPHGERHIKQISVARGNIVLADHGNTIREALLQDRYECGKFRPALSLKPLTQRGPFDLSLPASFASSNEMQEVLPDIYIEEYKQEGECIDCRNVGEEEQKNAIKWYPARDLLSTDRFSREFVVEVENDGTAQIRFGDGILGMEPETGTEQSPRKFCAVYRVGNGRTKGNVGAESIRRIIRTTSFLPDGIAMIRNPMPAKGARDPESLDEVRQYAPQAFMTLERAVTEEDYAKVLKRHPEVQRATAAFQWTGSWYTVFIMVDRFGGKEVDEDFKKEIRNFVEKYRLAGYDMEITRPRYAPSYIQMNVCVAPNHFSDKVEEDLLKAFGNRNLPDGRRGFFHPDNFTFGQSVYLSQIYETAMRVEGVSSVTITRFERLDKKSGDPLKEGVIRIGMSEIARFDMDQNHPENGRIDFVMEGGH